MERGAVGSLVIVGVIAVVIDRKLGSITITMAITRKATRALAVSQEVWSWELGIQAAAYVGGALGEPAVSAAALPGLSPAPPGGDQ